MPPGNPVKALISVSLLVLTSLLCGCADGLAWMRDIHFVAYSPSTFDPRPGHSRTPTLLELREDLKAIGAHFDGIITYGANPPADLVLRAAREQGFRGVVLGAWDVTSKEELAAAVRLAKEYPELVRAICVGNEGLHFGRYGMKHLSEAFAFLRRELPGMPLATSEPIYKYKDVSLQSLGDLHMPNIHPVFDLPPSTPPKQAAAWAIDRATWLAEVSRKAVLVKETGLPSGPAPRFTPDAQKEFWRELRVQLARRRDSRIAFAAFEAFDLPWKAQQAYLPIEEHWGMFTHDRKPKPAIGAFAD